MDTKASLPTTHGQHNEQYHFQGYPSGQIYPQQGQPPTVEPPSYQSTYPQQVSSANQAPYPQPPPVHAPLPQQPSLGHAPYPQQPTAPPGHAAYPQQPSPRQATYPHQPQDQSLYSIAEHDNDPVQPNPQKLPPGEVQLSDSTTVTMTTTTVNQVSQTVVYRHAPVQTHCPYCNTDVITKLQYKKGMITWAICCIICLIGGWCGCCLIPFCAKSCKDVVHVCPNCSNILSVFKRV
ncbi:uncharacterized protein LOC100375692 [Saccoglossus kowalevskii]|uniref:Cell death-inducing p53-target protein 1-like n=1 Tax=Saccoglossus kowalevskii TaxID=10224 RepID=A0ABM0GXU4_SACKO|nr:PREDICTED: cell death-inducing p53-target protein 1-like [Saccoglossus kowalevskii]